MIQLALNALTLASIYFLFGVGMSLVWGTIGVLNFAHGAIFVGSAFASYLALQVVRLPLVGIMTVGVVAGAVIAIIVQWVAFGPILKREKNRHSGEMQIISAGVGLSSVIVALAQMIYNEPFGLAGGSFEITSFKIGHVVLSNVSVIIIGLAIALGLILAIWVQKSIHGAALRSIGVDPRTASLMGINRAKMALAVLAVSGALAGLAGTMLTLYLGAIETVSGESLLLKAFAVIVLGGVGSIPGALVGSLALATAETVLLTYTSGTWVDAVSFGLIFAILLLRPRGIFGTAEIRRT